MRRVRLAACVVCLAVDRCDFRRGRPRGKRPPASLPRKPRRPRFRTAEKNIALLDVNALCKSDPEFTKAMEEIKDDTTRARIDMNNESNAIKAEAAEVEKLPSDSPQRAQRQAQTLRRQGRLAGPRHGPGRPVRPAPIQGLFRRLREDPTALWIKYAKAHKLTVVVNFNSEP